MNPLAREPSERSLLLDGGGSVDPVVDRVAELPRQFPVHLARIAPQPRADLGRQQRRDHSVLVRGPHGPVHAQEGSPGALFSAEAQGAAEQALDEPLEAHRHFVKPAPQLRRDPVDHAARYHGLADRRILPPAGTVLEQVVDRDREVMIRRQQPGASGDDAMAIVIGVAGEGHIEAVLQSDQAAHGVRRRRVHADPPVPIQGHEAEGGIDGLVDHSQVESVPLGDRPPVVDAGASQRIDAQLQPGRSNRLHVDDVRQVGHVGVEVVVPVGRGRA